MDEPLNLEHEIVTEKDPVLEFREEMENRIKAAKGPVEIVPHSGMDRDCFYAAVVLRNVLRKKFPDKQIDVRISDDESDEKSAKLENEMNDNGVSWNRGDFPDRIQRAGLVLLVDNYEDKRAGVNVNLGKEKRKQGAHMILDHHGVNVNTKDDYIEPVSKATCELVARMYTEELDPSNAKMIALGILSDSGKLAFIKDENIRTMDTYRKVLKISGTTTTELINELPHFSEEQLAPIKKTEQPLSIPGFPDDEVLVFSEPAGGISIKDYGELTTEVLDGAIKIREIEKIGDEMTAEEKAAEARKADFSIFVRPVDFTSDGQMRVEIKMRSNIFSFADEIGELNHRGGNPYAAKFEYRPPREIEESWAKADDAGKKEIEEQIQEQAKNKFALEYSQARHRRLVRDEVIKEYLLTKEQSEKFREIVRKRIKSMDNPGILDEFDSKYGISYRKNPDLVEGFDQQIGKAFDEYVRQVDSVE